MKKTISLLTAMIFLVVALVALPIFSMAGDKRPKILSFATLPSGTSSYAITVVLCNVMSKHSGYKVTAEPVGTIGKWGPLMESGEIDLGFGGVLSTAKTLRELGKTAITTKNRTIAAGHLTKYVFVARGDAGINTIADLEGKKVLTTWRAEVHNLGVRKVLDHYGLTGKVKELKITSPRDVYKSLKEGKVDAAFFTVSPQTAELKRTRGLTVLGIPKDLTKSIANIEPSILVSSYPKGYLGILKDEIPALAFRVMLLAHEDLADDVIQNLLKALHDHNSELKAGYPLAAQYSIDEIPWETKIPFHSGAIKYYKDIGIWDARAKALQKKLLSGE